MKDVMISVEELAQRYLMTKTGLKHSTLMGYSFAQKPREEVPTSQKMFRAI